MLVIGLMSKEFFFHPVLEVLYMCNIIINFFTKIYIIYVFTYILFYEYDIKWEYNVPFLLRKL